MIRSRDACIWRFCSSLAACMSVTAALPTKPNRPPPGPHVIDGVCDHLESELIQQSLVFGGVQACMIQGVAAILADAFAVVRAAVEHQHRAFACMLCEDGEHSPLRIVIEMEETIPGQNAVEASP